jgi:hypothetical protein
VPLRHAAMKLRTRGRFNVKRLSRALADRLQGTPFDRAVHAAATAGRHEFVFGWNRGLGDIALGLVPLFARIRAADASSRIVVFTRADLADAFRLTDADAVHVDATAVRGPALDPVGIAARDGIVLAPAATIFADPDPTRWLDGQRQAYPPSLRWDGAWDARADRLLPADAGTVVIGAHVNSETAQHYGYVKDWPADHWRALFACFPRAPVRWALFGHAATDRFAQANVVDLRGATDFLDLLALIRTRCRVLVAPDSGVLTCAYYLAQASPLAVVSLWSDPRQGILKQGCPSPNPALAHVPLLGRDEDVRNITVAAVADAVRGSLAAAGFAVPAAEHPC